MSSFSFSVGLGTLGIFILPLSFSMSSYSFSVGLGTLDIFILPLSFSMSSYSFSVGLGTLGIFILPLLFSMSSYSFSVGLGTLDIFILPLSSTYSPLNSLSIFLFFEAADMKPISLISAYGILSNAADTGQHAFSCVTVLFVISPVSFKIKQDSIYMYLT